MKNESRGDKKMTNWITSSESNLKKAMDHIYVSTLIGNHFSMNSRNPNPFKQMGIRDQCHLRYFFKINLEI